MTTVKELAEKAGCSRAWVYKKAKQLGRLPTVEELLATKGKVGRKPKYFIREGE